MRRDVIPVIVASVLALTAPGAAQVLAQPELSFVERDGRGALVGAGIHNADGAGQQRSVIVDRHVTLAVFVENDGSGTDRVEIAGSAAARGYRVRYLGPGGNDVTTRVVRGRFSLRIETGAPRSLTVTVTARRDAPLGAVQPLLITATSTTDPSAVDAVRAEITKVSTPDA